MSRPAIAICAGLENASWGVWKRPAVLLPEEYVTAVLQAGGLPLLIPPDEELTRSPDEVLDRIDGLMLAGGGDVDPAAYGEAKHPQTNGTVPLRDAPELVLAKRAIERDIPLLGICRGMQVLNVAYGGTLVQHVPDLVGNDEHRRNPGTFDGNEHDVRLTPGSLAAKAAGEELHETLSHHHQAVAEIGHGLDVTGFSTLDELPEAIEDPSRTFVLGVQWHPEADERSRLVAALVQEARAYRARINGSA
jgi:putative glutamine amidotransferase